MRQLSFGIFSTRVGDELPVAPEIDDLLDAITAVDGQRPEDGEINQQNDPVEGVELIEWTDISPGFVDHVVEVLLEDGLRRRPFRAGPGSWCWGLKNHELRYIQRRKILPQRGEHCDAAGPCIQILRSGAL